MFVCKQTKLLIRLQLYLYPYSIYGYLYSLGAFYGQDRELGYDNHIISCCNLLFDVPTRYDNLFHLFILSYHFFVIYILSLSWVRTILSKVTTKIFILPSPPLPSFSIVSSLCCSTSSSIALQHHFFYVLHI